MKPSSFLACALLAALLPGAALGAKNQKKQQRPAHAHGSAATEALKPFDKNANQQIDPDELAPLQQSFSALKKLDANSNGEIEQSEIDSLKSSAPDPARGGRALAGFRQVDKNSNRKIDPEEVPELEKLLGGSRLMSRLDQNGNGKLEPAEVERLNERVGKGMGRAKGGTSSSAPSLSKPPEKPAAPPVPPTPEEEKVPEPTKPAAPAAEPTPPGNFGT